MCGYIDVCIEPSGWFLESVIAAVVDHRCPARQQVDAKDQCGDRIRGRLDKRAIVGCVTDSGG